MDRDAAIHRAQGRRLAAAREAAGFRSARAAALENGWPESTYRAHEAGTRTMGQDDADRYARRFRQAGATISAQAILFGPAKSSGDNPAAVGADDVQLVPKISWVAASKMADTGEVLNPSDAPKIALSDLPSGDWFALTVQGDSMDKVAPDGSIILINRKERRLVPKAYYVFGHRGQATFKQYLERPTRLLMPCSNNSTHEAIIPTRDYEVIGRVRRVLVDL